MPAEGYTRMFERMLDHPNITVMLGTDYADIQDQIEVKRTVFTGCNMQTAEAIEIAASEDMKLTASAAGSCPP